MVGDDLDAARGGRHAFKMNVDLLAMNSASMLLLLVATAAMAAPQTNDVVPESYTANMLPAGRCACQQPLTPWD